MRFCVVCLARFLWRRKTPMNLKSEFRMGQGHWKLHHWIPHVSFLVINCTRGRIVYRLWEPSTDPKSLYLLPILRLTAPTEGFPWDDLREILRGSQRMAKVHSSKEILPNASTPRVGCTNVTDDRQTDHRRICDSKDPNVT